MCCSARRRPAEARAELRSILARGPDAEASWLLSRAHLQEGASAAGTGGPQGGGFVRRRGPDPPRPGPVRRCGELRGMPPREIRGPAAFPPCPDLPSRLRSLATSALPRPSFPDPAEPEVTHTLRKAGDRLVHETHTPGRIFKAVVDYAFGSGDRGKTLVGREASGPAFELRLSLYREGQAVGLGRDERTSPPPRGGPGLPGDAADRRRGPPLLLVPRHQPRVAPRDPGARGGRPCDRLREMPRPRRQPPAGRRRQVPRPGDRPPEPGLGLAGGEDLRPVPQPSWQGRLAGRSRRRFASRARR